MENLLGQDLRPDSPDYGSACEAWVSKNMPSFTEAEAQRFALEFVTQTKSKWFYCTFMQGDMVENFMHMCQAFLDSDIKPQSSPDEHLRLEHDKNPLFSSPLDETQTDKQESVEVSGGGNSENLADVKYELSEGPTAKCGQKGNLQQQFKSGVQYLSPEALSDYPDVRLLSSDGYTIELSRVVLGAMSAVLRDALLDVTCDLTAVIQTELIQSELDLFYSLATTGEMPRPFVDDAIPGFIFVTS